MSNLIPPIIRLNMILKFIQFILFLRLTRRNGHCLIIFLFFSLLIGNLFFFFEFNNSTEITASKRMILFAVLTVVGVLGMLIMFLIRNVTVPERQSTNDLQRYHHLPFSSF